MNTDEPKHKNIKTYNVQRTTYNLIEFTKQDTTNKLCNLLKPEEPP